MSVILNYVLDVACQLWQLSHNNGTQYPLARYVNPHAQLCKSPRPLGNFACPLCEVAK